jgi:serine/threonine protein kinase
VGAGVLLRYAVWVQSPEIIGRYALYEKVASGGMATVHIGRLLGPVGFSRTVAIKRMHAQFTGDPQFVSMFLDEARLAARVRHPNVVSTLDVVATNGELFLVLDYVQGETLAALLRRINEREEHVPIPIVAAIVSGVLHGLHAAHEAKNERGEPLGIVHRDISPQNVMVGSDGVARVLDFGVAKAAGRLHSTLSGELKGKLAYMPPEQIRGRDVSRRCDIYAASVVLWETLTGCRLFHDNNEGAILENVLHRAVAPPSQHRAEVPPELDEVVLRGLARDPEARYATAREMASALEAAVRVAIAPAVGAWVDGTAPDTISAQAERIAEIESASGKSGDESAIAGRKSFVDKAGSSQDIPVVGGDDLPILGEASQRTSSAVAAPLEARTLASQARRNVIVALSTTLVAVTATVMVMQRRAPAPTPVPTTTNPASPMVSDSVVAPSPVRPAPPPLAAEAPTEAGVASAVPSASPPATVPRTKRGASPPRASPNSTSTPPPKYNPLDHL